MESNETTPSTVPSHERAFLTWANTFLSKRKLKAKATLDFDNGLMLLNLLELLSSKAIARKFKYELRPRTRTAKINNTLYCLKFMEDEGIELTSNNGNTNAANDTNNVITNVNTIQHQRLAELIVDNDAPSVLSILWKLVVFYHLRPLFPYKKDYRTAFWTWAEKKMNCKLSPSVWVSGEGFYRLCYSICPDILPPLKTIQRNLLMNMITIMENDFKVPLGMISEPEFVQRPSDPPVLMAMVYLARFRIEQFKVERKKMIQSMGSDRLCCLSTLPEELLMNVMTLMSDPLPWLFVNC